jgi:hypothetical protein
MKINMKRQFLAVTIIAGFTILTGTGSALLSRSLDSPDTTEVQTTVPSMIPFESPDGSFQLMALNSWRTVELSAAEQQNNIVFALSAPQDVAQLSVIALSKQDGMTPEILAQAIRTSAEVVVGDSGTLTTTSLTEINGMPTTQYEGQGEFNNNTVGVLSTGVDTPDTYYNILVVGYAADLEAMENDLNQIIQSFDVNAQ